MKSSKFSFLKIFCLLLGFCIVVSSAHAGFEEISFPGAAITAPLGLSDNGTIVGIYYQESLTGSPGIFLYENGIFTSMLAPVPQGPVIIPLDINNDGIVVGTNDSHAFVFDGGEPVELNCPFVETGPGDIEMAVGINNAGQIVGFDYYDTPRPQGVYGFLYDGGVFEMLQYTEGDEPAALTAASGINDVGLICGTLFDYADSNNHFQGFIYDGSEYRVFDYPGNDITVTIPMGINDAGKVVGWYCKTPPTSTEETIGFFWLQMAGGFVYDAVTGEISDFQWPNPAANVGTLFGINNAGQIVGACGYVDPEDPAYSPEWAVGFLYTPDDILCEEDDTGAIDIMGQAACVSDTQTIRVPIRIQNAYKPDPHNAVDAFGFEVTYNPAVLSFVAFERGDLLLGFDDVVEVIDVDHNEVETGVVRIGGFTTVNPIGPDQEGMLGDLVFYSHQAVSTSLGIQNMVDDIALWPASGACLTPATGDINRDGEVTPADALCAFEKAIDICATTCGPCDTVPCDVDQDCLCSASDSLCIFNRYLSIPSCLD